MPDGWKKRKEYIKMLLLDWGHNPDRELVCKILAEKLYLDFEIVWDVDVELTKEIQESIDKKG